MQAGQDILLTSGADIFAEGVQLVAGRHILADAANDVTIQSALSQSWQDSSQKDRSASVGINVGLGLQGVTVGANAGLSFQNANSESQSKTHTLARINAGGTVTIKSGQDTNIIGGRLEAQNIVADVGGNLNVKSVQDSYQYKSKSFGGSLSLSMRLGGAPLQNSDGSFNTALLSDTANSIGTTYKTGGADNTKTAGLSINYDKGTVERLWTTEQSAFVAQDGVDITVAGNTHLKGAVITSESGNLSLDTATLTHEDIYDQDKSEHFGFAFGLSRSWGGPGDDASQQQKAAAGDLFDKAGFSVEGTYEKTDKEGISRATVTEGALTIRDQAKQAELETSGKTQKLSSINRNIDAAQEITKDEREYLGVYVTDTSLKAVRNIAEKAAQYINELVTEGKITSERAKELKKLKEAAKDGQLEITCGVNHGWLNKLHNLFFTPAYAEGDGCIVRFRGASALYDGQSIRLSQEEVDALNKQTALEITGKIKFLVANIENIEKSHPGSLQHQKLEQDLEKQLKYLALCTTHEEFNGFIRNTAFFNAPKYKNTIEIAKNFKASGDHFAEHKLGTSSTLKTEMLAKAKSELQNNPGLLQVLTEREQSNNAIGDPLIDATLLVYWVKLDPSLSQETKRIALADAGKIIGREWENSERTQGRRTKQGKPSATVTITIDPNARNAVEYVKSELANSLISDDVTYFTTQVNEAKAQTKQYNNQGNQLKRYVANSIDEITDATGRVLSLTDKSRLAPVIDPETGEPIKVRKTRSAGRNGGDPYFFADLYVYADTGQVVEVRPDGSVIATPWDMLSVADAASNLSGVGSAVKASGKLVVTKVGVTIFGKSAMAEFVHEGIQTAIKNSAASIDDIALGIMGPVGKSSHRFADEAASTTTKELPKDWKLTIGAKIEGPDDKIGHASIILEGPKGFKVEKGKWPVKDTGELGFNNKWEPLAGMKGTIDNDSEYIKQYIRKYSFKTYQIDVNQAKNAWKYINREQLKGKNNSYNVPSDHCGTFVCNVLREAGEKPPTIFPNSPASIRKTIDSDNK